MARKVKTSEPTKSSVFVIRPPSNTTSKYILLVSRSGGMMGTQTAAFSVDRMIVDTTPDNKAVTVKGVMDNPFQVVVEFPVGTSYLLVRREDMRIITQIELAKEQREEEKELEEFYAPAGEANVAPVVDAVTGQYL